MRGQVWIEGMSGTVAFSKTIFLFTDYVPKYLSLCRVFAELRSCVDPPDAILHIVQAVLLILCPGQECETWAHCKQVELL